MSKYDTIIKRIEARKQLRRTQKFDYDTAPKDIEEFLSAFLRMMSLDYGLSGFQYETLKAIHRL